MYSDQLARAIGSDRLLGAAYIALLDDAVEDEFPDELVSQWTQAAGLPCSWNELHASLEKDAHSLERWSGSYRLVRDGVPIRILVNNREHVTVGERSYAVESFEGTTATLKAGSETLRLTFRTEGFDRATLTVEPLVRNRCTIHGGAYDGSTASTVFVRATNGPIAPRGKRVTSMSADALDAADASDASGAASMAQWNGSYATMVGPVGAAQPGPDFIIANGATITFGAPFQSTNVDFDPDESTLTWGAGAGPPAPFAASSPSGLTFFLYADGRLGFSGSILLGTSTSETPITGVTALPQAPAPSDWTTSVDVNTAFTVIAALIASAGVVLGAFPIALDMYRRRHEFQEADKARADFEKLRTDLEQKNGWSPEITIDRDSIVREVERRARDYDRIEEQLREREHVVQEGEAVERTHAASIAELRKRAQALQDGQRNAEASRLREDATRLEREVRERRDDRDKEKKDIEDRRREIEKKRTENRRVAELTRPIRK